MLSVGKSWTFQLSNIVHAEKEIMETNGPFHVQTVCEQDASRAQ